MSQATTEPTTPTTGDVLARVGETLAALQDAEKTCVEAAQKLYEHTQDGNAHGAGLQENIGREVPRPVWQGTALAFQKADGTTVAEAVDLKGQKGDRGEAGPRPEHRWDGTCLTVQSADGSWPENGVDLKGGKGDRGEAGPRPEHRWDGTRLTVQNADGSWPESGVDLKGEKGDAGKVALSDAVDSESRETAASSLAVKTAYDAATAAQSAADAAQATATAAGETADAAKQAATAAQETASAADAAADEAKAAAEAAQEKAEQALSGITVLAGGIIAFSGTFGGAGKRHPIPLGGSEPDTGWVLCDGGSDGKGGAVPDLRGRMIMGASAAYAAGSTGGTAEHAHPLSGSVGATTLTEAQIASHQHPIYNLGLGKFAGNSPDTALWSSWSMGQTRYANAAGGSQPHTHPLSGASGQASSLPPYYALAYIMRVA